MIIQTNTSSKNIDNNYWEELCSKKNVFMSLAFKEAFEKHHQKNIQSLYYHFDDNNNKGVGYAQNFIIGGNKIHSYQRKNKISQSVLSAILRLLKLKVIALGNGLLTNISNLHIEKVSDKKLFIYSLLNNFQKKFQVKKFIFPDHFFTELGIDNPIDIIPELIKIEVDEDMRMNIPKKWNTFEDYTQALKKKYRSRLKRVLKKSDAIEIKHLKHEELQKHAERMQELFINVHQKSAFGIAPFNTEIFKDLITINNPQCIVFGYFLKNKMIAFSSELRAKTTLYSYFIGLDYEYNRSHRLYERILLENIKEAIINRKDELVFGRTAAEFKSNVGATPSQSHIYIYLKNPILRYVLKPILTQIKPKKWIQRKPFK